MKTTEDAPIVLRCYQATNAGIGSDYIYLDPFKRDDKTGLDCLHYHELNDFNLEWYLNYDRYSSRNSDGTCFEHFRAQFKPYSLDNSRDAARMLKVLTKIEKGLDKIAEELGHAKTFTQYLARVCIILKIKQIAFHRKDGSEGYHAEYQFLNIGSAVERIERMQQEVRTARNPQHLTA